MILTQPKSFLKFEKEKNNFYGVLTRKSGDPCCYNKKNNYHTE